jgi:hypothetical protein
VEWAADSIAVDIGDVRLTDGELGERVSAGLRELLRHPARAPVVVLATLWPSFWDNLTARRPAVLIRILRRRSRWPARTSPCLPRSQLHRYSSYG